MERSFTPNSLERKEEKKNEPSYSLHPQKFNSEKKKKKKKRSLAARFHGRSDTPI